VGRSEVAAGEAAAGAVAAGVVAVEDPGTTVRSLWQ
jgi:hypothetical protein